VLSRPLCNYEAEESYPSLLFDECVDCYRTSLLSDDEIDKRMGLPKPLLPFVRTRGENELSLCLDPASAADGFAAKGSCDPMDTLSEHRNWVLPQPFSFVLSASALETYTSCPFSWFATRRLGITALDADFGPLEKGSFAHAVLHDFYEQVCALHIERSELAQLPQAQDLFEQVFNKQLAYQLELEPLGKGLVPQTVAQENELSVLHTRLLQCVHEDAAMLNTFEPRYFEFRFGYDEPVEYAGMHIRGSIDRIDVNSKGQAVIIDYKGSVSSHYEFASQSTVDVVGNTYLPNKIQALVYAQVVRRLLGLTPVAALYVSYGTHAAVEGAVDSEVLSPSDIPLAHFDKCVVHSFATRSPEVVKGSKDDVPAETEHCSFLGMLDELENQLACACSALKQGSIKAAPRTKHSCTYCPVSYCPQRENL
jgi:hypothetical protein